MTRPLALLHALATSPPFTGSAASDENVVSATGNVLGDVFSNLGNNGYQTGFAIIAGATAVIAMVNLKVQQWVIAPVALGAFWAGWLLWNTIMREDNPLFPGDPAALKIWDVARTGERGFLIASIVGSVAAYFLWKKGTAVTSRLWLLVGATLGASFVYNLVEAVQSR